MTKIREYIPEPRKLTEPTAQDFADFHRLVGQLSSKQRTLEAVSANVGRAVSSPNTTVLTVRDPEQDWSIQGTATVTVARTHRGPDAWIDDVVTDESVRGQGFSKPLMSLAEGIANIQSDEVRLTSSATREAARAGYASRGYRLDTGRLYRNERLRATAVEGVEQLTELHEQDVDSVAVLLGGADPTLTEYNLKLALDSPLSKLFVVRSLRNTIQGITTSVVCPIPVGFKAWSHVDARNDSDAAALIAAAEFNLPPEATAMNTTFAPPAEAGDYTLRDSGLYTLAMSGAALAAGQWQNRQRSS